MCVCLCVFKWGKPRERIERKDHLASAEYYTKSLEKRELLKKEGERKEGKSGRACWVFRGLSTPANEKLLSIFHHTHTRESFLDIPLLVKWLCIVA